jgi:tetratricopeptide (TPR) repeat protein
LLDLGAISHLRGDQRNAEPLLRQSLELFSKSHDAAGEATAHQWLGVVALAAGGLDTAATHFEESLKKWRRLGNQQMTAADLGNLGETRYLAGAFADAEALYREALNIYDSLGDPMGRGFVVSQLGRLALDRKQTEAAVTLLLDGLRLRWDAGDRGGAADTLDALAEAVVQTGDLNWARKAVAVGEVLRIETGIARLPVYAERFAAVKDAIDEPVAEASGSIDELMRDVMAARPASLTSPG